jgi:hypothetical protein
VGTHSLKSINFRKLHTLMVINFTPKERGKKINFSGMILYQIFETPVNIITALNFIDQFNACRLTARQNVGPVRCAGCIPTINICVKYNFF